MSEREPMSESLKHHAVSRPLTRRAAVAALCVLSAIAVIDCESGTGIIGTASAPSTDASLKALTISSGTLVPAFDSATTTYAAAVTFATSTVTVTPTTTKANATVAVNGTLVTSGSPSSAINLAVGTNTIVVLVTAEDGTTIRTYSISVVRAST